MRGASGEVGVKEKSSVSEDVDGSYLVAAVKMEIVKGKRKFCERERVQGEHSYKKLRLTDIVCSAIKMLLKRIKGHSELNLAHREQKEGHSQAVRSGCSGLGRTLLKQPQCPQLGI